MTSPDDFDIDAFIEDAIADHEDYGGRKRSFADAQSLHDATTSLGAADSKRPRATDGSSQQFAPITETEEQAMLEAAVLMQPSQTVTGFPGQTATATFRHMSDTEEQALLEAAVELVPSQQVGGSQSGWHGATTASFLQQQQQLRQQWQASRPGQQTTASVGGGRGGLGGGLAEEDEEEIDLDAAIEEFLNEQAEEEAQQHQQQGQALPLSAAEQVQQLNAATGAQLPAGTSAAAAAEAHAARATAAPQPAVAGPAVEDAQRSRQQHEVSIIPVRPYVPPAKLSTAIPGACISVTAQDGERVYCALQEAPAGAAAASRGRPDLAGMLRRARGRLLSTSIDSLLEAVEQDRLHRAKAESAAAAAAAAEAVSPGGAVRRQQQQQQSAPGAQQRQAAAASALWVDKYAPKAFMDLLSDEHTNREVVRWLKSWDPCVFGTPAPAPPAGRQQQRYQQAQQQGGQREGGGQAQLGRGAGASGGLDALGRPEYKVILLAGPPGLGKTTLAHVCAAHCGYRPVEINASDERGGATLQGRVLDAVEMQSVMGQRRPNCVVIDEIDGAAGGAEGRSAIAALLKIVSAAPGKGSQPADRSGNGGSRRQVRPQSGGSSEQESDSEGEEGEEERSAGGIGSNSGARAGGRHGAAGVSSAAAGAKGPRRQQLRPLMRPIICICNDLYAPALRPLREVARVFHFKKPSTERLAQRLQLVCAAEGLQCEKSTLRLLAERAEGDIRSCLNTLQFLAKRQAVVRLADVAGISIGQKDMTKGAFAVWNELLIRKKQQGIIGRAPESEGQRTARLLNSLQDFGEHDLVLNGMHENLLQLRYFDAGLTRTAAVLSHMADADALLRACHRGGGSGGLLRYLPAALVQASNLVASHERPQLQWPRTISEARRAQLHARSVLQGWTLAMCPSVAAAISPQALLLETLPALMHVAAPSLRPVSQQLYSREEQAALQRLVGTLLSLGLRFAAEAQADRAAEQGQQGFAARHAQQQQQQLQQGLPGMMSADAAARAALVSRGEPPLQFRPPVHRLTAFPGMPAKGRALPAAVRQAVSHEADMEAIRRADAARQGQHWQQQQQQSPSPAAGSGGAGPVGADHSSRQQLQPARTTQQPAGQMHTGVVPLTLADRMKAIAAAAGGGGAGAGTQQQRRQGERKKGNWLDQLRDQRSRAASAKGGAAGGAGGTGKQRFPVLYKFNEGYTNAVKRPLVMADLL